MFKKYSKIRISVLLLIILISVNLTSCIDVKQTLDVLNEYQGKEPLYQGIILENLPKGKGFAEGKASISLIEDERSKADDFISSTSAFLFNAADGTVLYEKNIYERIAPASITKILTALMTIEKCSMDDYVTLSEGVVIDYPDAQVAGFLPGDTVNVGDILSAMLVYSGNDCAAGLGEYISGDLDTFAADCNERARQLGCVDTSFKNPHGLDEKGHYTSAYDLYLIFSECMKHDEFLDNIRLTNTSFSYITRNGTTSGMNLYTTNRYLSGVYSAPEGIDVFGGKTGTTENAGCCLICLFYDSEGTPYIGASFGNEDYSSLYENMNRMLSLIGD